jgi:glutamine amidotransferase
MTMQRVAVVDYGMGNLHSVAKALQHVGARWRCWSPATPAIIAGADRVVFPGVGAIRDCMGELTRRGLAGAIRQGGRRKAAARDLRRHAGADDPARRTAAWPASASCPGEVRFFGNLARGCRRQHAESAAHGLERGAPGTIRCGPASRMSRFYFVHSYYVQPAQIAAWWRAACEYGVTPFAAALARGNLFAVQFHPEKSHTAGLQLLANFVAWNGRELECAC